MLNKMLTCTLHFKLCPEQPSSWYNTSWIPIGHCSVKLDCNYHVNILCSDMQIWTHTSCVIFPSPWNVDLCSMFWEFLMKQGIKCSSIVNYHNSLTLDAAPCFSIQDAKQWLCDVTKTHILSSILRCTYIQHFGK